MPLSAAAATMPAIAVPWPFGSDVEAEPTSDVPPTSLPARSGCEASTPVSRTATVAEPAIGRAIDRIPADLRQGPLRGVAGVGRIGLGRAAAVRLHARDARIRVERGDGGGTRVHGLHAKGGDRVGGGRTGRGDRGGLVGGGHAGRERDDEGTRRLGRRGRGRLRGGLGRGFGAVARRSRLGRGFGWRLGRRFRGRLSGRRRVGRWRSARLLGWRRRGRWIRGVGGHRSGRRHQGEDKEADLQPDQESPNTTHPPMGGPGTNHSTWAPRPSAVAPAGVRCALVAATTLPDDDGWPYGHWATVSHTGPADRTMRLQHRTIPNRPAPELAVPIGNAGDSPGPGTDATSERAGPFGPALSWIASSEAVTARRSSPRPPGRRANGR